MSRPWILLYSFWTAVLMALPTHANDLKAAAQPNILFILADDIGYGDLGCYGASLVKTPNLDRLARTGRQFTDAHSPASTCTPSRRAFLTGTYSWRQQAGSAILPGNASLSIPRATTTVASLLHSAGYRTGVVGKWHLGLGDAEGPDWNGEIKPGPLEIGFDYGFFFPATGDRVPCIFVENHRIVNLDPKDPIRVSYHSKVGDEPTGSENPGLLKLRATHGHDNTIVNGIGRIGWMTGGKSARWKDEEIADTLARKAIGFIEASPGKPFFLYLATNNIHVPRVPNPRFVGSSQCGTRGDAIQELDDTVGQVLAALDRNQLTSNTLVIFTSDNGGIDDDGYEDRGSFNHKMNGNLRGTKGTVFEGGHRVPCLARWPGQIAEGSQSSALITMLDMPATFAALTGVATPAGTFPDSINLLPALLGTQPEAPGRDLFIAHNGGTQGPFGIRQVSWKLILDKKGPQGKAQLFDLSKDLSETKNLASKHPEIVEKLRELFKIEAEKLKK